MTIKICCEKGIQKLVNNNSYIEDLIKLVEKVLNESLENTIVMRK